MKAEKYNRKLVEAVSFITLPAVQRDQSDNVVKPKARDQRRGMKP